MNLKFVPPKSFVNPNFWYKFADIKLYHDRLNDSPKNIHAYINASANDRILVEIDCTGFNDHHTTQANRFVCPGILLNKNTIKEFKLEDKTSLIKHVSNDYYKDLFAKERLVRCTDILFFVLLSFADFKAHKYYYWFASPALRDAVYEVTEISTKLNAVFQHDDIMKFEQLLNSIDMKIIEPFFVYNAAENSIFTICDLISHRCMDRNFQGYNLNNILFCCYDRSVNNNPSWLLRQFLGYLVMTCPQLLSKKIKCICLREKLGESIVHQIMLPSDKKSMEENCWIGWETNDDGRFVPRLSNMFSVMDPLVLSEKCINLNLALMKWRLLPNLDLDVIKKTKFLLLGSGTLGCGVARSLLAWGAQHITFIDNGTVSLSNPVRQSLFLYEDAINGGKPKATTAAKRLKQIHPGIVSSGYCIKIPMPGHSVGTAEEKEIQTTLNELENLIKNHDVIYLLTDSRESRWLPTLLTKYFKKITITAALGFDSFLVMRHGTNSSTSVQSKCIEGFKEVSGTLLGCYYCNDITAPGNSLHDRTLDQQCTVTRPAVSNIASSLAVELTIALLQQAERDAIPAYYKLKSACDSSANVPEEILGIVPHSIRGSIDVFSYLITATEKFSECIACSKPIMDKYAEDGKKFILEVLNSPKYLENIAGISKLTSSVDEVIDLDSDIE